MQFEIFDVSTAQLIELNRQGASWTVFGNAG